MSDIIRIVFNGGISENAFKYSLTIGKVYNAEKFLDYYVLNSDNGIRYSYPKYLFKTLDEVRNKKLDILLD